MKFMGRSILIRHDGKVLATGAAAELIARPVS
jgi:ABC-type antimicrobial peptide transport system ATPase subunit